MRFSNHSARCRPRLPLLQKSAVFPYTPSTESVEGMTLGWIAAWPTSPRISRTDSEFSHHRVMGLSRGARIPTRGSPPLRPAGVNPLHTISQHAGMGMAPVSCFRGTATTPTGKRTSHLARDARKTQKFSRGFRTLHSKFLLCKGTMVVV
jgi:hypothetical protein